MGDPAAATYEARMLIDGELVDGEAGAFTNINPATEEVLGEVTDASKADMHRAIDAARRSFDETDWSTNHQLRKRCLEQLHEAIDGEREELIREVGAPRAVTHGPHLDAPPGTAPDTPFGSYKNSGVGRHNGLVGFSQYTEVKSVAFPADLRQQL
jgi:aldehyde dehydrogenase (NAD+)